MKEKLPYLINGVLVAGSMIAHPDHSPTVFAQDNSNYEISIDKLQIGSYQDQLEELGIEIEPIIPEIEVKPPWECDVVAKECTEEHVQAAIELASIEQGVSRPLLECLSQHESGMNPYKVSATNDHGPFQYHINPPVYFRQFDWTMMDITPWADHSYYEPYGSAQAAAWLVRHGYAPASKGGWTTYAGCSQLFYLF